MELSIIIVNWKSVAYLRKCLATVYANTPRPTFEVVVIDSASYDGSDKMLREEYPQVKFIQSDKNLGFARANNAAVATSTGETLLFLNPDTELVGPAITTLYDTMQGLPQPGAIGARLLNTDGTLQSSCIQSFPTVINQVFDADGLRKRFPRSRLWGMAPLFDAKTTPSEADAISGACLMMKRSLFLQVGEFSTDYFMYSEDVDLCFKARKAGARNYYVPAAVIVHHGGASSSQSKVNVFSSVMLLESRWRFFLKTRPVWYCWLYRSGMFTISLVRLAIAVVLRWAGALRRKGVVAWDSAITKWSARLRWSLGLERWAKSQ